GGPVEFHAVPFAQPGDDAKNAEYQHEEDDVLRAQVPAGAFVQFHLPSPSALQTSRVQLANAERQERDHDHEGIDDIPGGEAAAQHGLVMAQQRQPVHQLVIALGGGIEQRSEEHTSELQSREN